MLWAKMIPLQDFLSTSTIHGLSHIGSAKSWPLRLFWIVVVIAGFGIASYLIISSYTEWAKSPVSSTTITRPIFELDFPEVTVCPPKGSNTLNQALSQVKDEKLTPGIRQNLKKVIDEVFFENPSMMFAKDMTYIMTMHTLTDFAEGTVKIPEKNRNNLAGENTLLIKTSLSKGSFSTPGYKDVDYQGNFYEMSHLIHFQLNILFNESNENSLVVNVDIAEGAE